MSNPTSEDTSRKKIFYNTFEIPKRNGKVRQIEAPSPFLKKKQKNILKRMMNTFKISPFAHGFSPYRNVATMAMNHVGKEYVVAMDIKNFFPSINIDIWKTRISEDPNILKRMLRNKEDMGSKNLNNLLIEIEKYCFHDFGDGQNKRLPQGAPTSPMISNLFLFSFDWKMAWVSYKRKVDYTRYADDIVLSGSNYQSLKIMMKAANRYAERLQLSFDPQKTKVMKTSQRQLVCGVVTNEKLNVSRKYRKNLRAEIHQKSKDGQELPPETQGKIAFVNMVRNNTKTTHSSSNIINSIVVAKKMQKRVAALKNQ